MPHAGARLTVRIAEATAPEIAARLRAGTPVLLPMGSLETHGPALPMGDYLLAAAIAERIAAAAGALALPAIPFGGEDFFAAIPGAVALPGPVLRAVIEACAGALLRHGTRRILIVNGHGGSIPAIEAAQRGLRQLHGVVVPALHLWRAAASLHAALGGDAAALGHGADPVFSVALFLRPDLCHPDRVAPPAPPPPCLGLPVAGFGEVTAGGIGFAVPMDVAQAAPGGVAGDATRASAALGEKLVARLVDAGAAMVAQLREQTG